MWEPRKYLIATRGETLVSVSRYVRVLSVEYTAGGSLYVWALTSDDWGPHQCRDRKFVVLGEGDGHNSVAHADYLGQFNCSGCTRHVFDLGNVS